MHSFPFFAIASKAKQSSSIGKKSWIAASAAPPRNDGFSLVELSIVLVILGLLTGGILAGQSLIRASEIRSVMTDAQKYQSAIYTFRDKYFALPGDMTNATAFWGVLAGDGANAACQDTAATGLPTCNGNGDGWIAGNNVAYSERFRALQHLANAGLIEGSYTGKTSAASGSASCTATSGCAPSKISNGLFVPVEMPNLPTGDASLFSTPRANAIYFTTNSPAIKPEEAWNIDTKMDDGKVSYGAVRGLKPTATFCTANCATTAVDSTAEYNLTLTSNACCLYFYLR